MRIRPDSFPKRDGCSGRRSRKVGRGYSMSACMAASRSWRTRRSASSKGRWRGGGGGSLPAEGSPGWHGGLCLSSRADPKVVDAAYAYFNWWLEGWAGAQLARQGYYMSVPERTRAHLSDAEWSYWYLGLAARQAIL